ncbi:EscU/YscU/HrcU family type III secretion system export apparatus switch protein [Alkalihalobacillus sp. AL-G]|uniref:EscU/YscU/HrcU family type III secretion system export apparatus switch protein n=1 Tax=Alkalihalobacillus sp. AL-G TaxID=2926399 RepID=UPI00272A473C|nr:EscU/YscU/HrcU family type III secretion system export apparatus switch protein [Alkalihalobacillus sp. AL-G]WLD95136.1 EscU/YscU/HrcU family type III secretion system export apparatus switch protein [Alkalihalobacillus sp. AL-G]
MSDKNVRKSVVAMKYEESRSAAPRVIAKGKGATADEILSIANEYKIPVQEDPSLVQLLSKLDINEEIPPNLYQAVAEVFAFIYQLDQSVKRPD